MQRLNEKELSHRIHKFLNRKTSQFPELGPAASRITRDWRNDKTEYVSKEPTVYWRLQLS